MIRVFLNCCFAFLGFLSFFNIAYAIEIYVPLETIIIGEFIYEDDYTPTTDDCTISIYPPGGGTPLINEATMTDDATGWHRYSYVTPAVEGKYPTFITCGTLVGGDLLKLDKSFILKSSNITADDLSDIITVVTDATSPLATSAELAASEGVITSAISALNNITAASVWSSPTRSLTTYGTLVADVWSYSTRSLTTSSPPQVIITSMGNLAVPNITANVSITNEGFAGFEYQYEWCVVTSFNNNCGGGDDVAYASAAKKINAGENFDTVLSSTVPTAGSYYFKVAVFYGVEKSHASRSFDATSGGGGEGGGG